MKKSAVSKSRAFSFYLFFFIVFIVCHFFISRNYVFKTLGDNMTYLIGSESFYYDNNFIVDKITAERFITSHEPVTKKNFPPIIGRKTDNAEYSVAKPVIFMIFFSFFTPINNEVLRAQIANGILLFSWFVLLYLTVRTTKDSYKAHFFSSGLLTLFLFFSQTNFYLKEIHPEIYINTLILFGSFPLITQNSYAKNKYFYFCLGLIASVILSAKQVALVFPLIVLVYLFFSQKRKGFLPYLLGFLIGGCIVISTYQYLYHSFSPYDGARGMIKFDESDMTFREGLPASTFTFPLFSLDRFIEYFFGKNIGIVLYNSLFVLFAFLFLKFFIRKNIWNITFLPVFLYLGIYFGIIDPYFSYGGGTSLGNRYFFQIYGYVLIVIVLSLIKLKVRNEKFIAAGITISLLLFTSLFYLGFYQLFTRAIKDHIVIVENRKIFSFFPYELSYANLIYSDLPIENHIKGISVINKGYPLLREGDKYLLYSNGTYIIDYSNKIGKSGNKLFKTNGKLEKIKSNKNIISLYKLTCDHSQEQCYIL